MTHSVPCAALKFVETPRVGQFAQILRSARIFFERILTSFFLPAPRIAHPRKLIFIIQWLNEILVVIEIYFTFNVFRIDSHSGGFLIINEKNIEHQPPLNYWIVICFSMETYTFRTAELTPKCGLWQKILLNNFISCPFYAICDFYSRAVRVTNTPSWL